MQIWLKLEHREGELQVKIYETNLETVDLGIRRVEVDVEDSRLILTVLA